MDGAAEAPVAPPRDIRRINAGTDLYAVEADDFAATVLNGKPACVSAADSIGNMVVLDEMRKQIGLRFTP
jgi:hypothetical protein